MIKKVDLSPVEIILFCVVILLLALGFFCPDSRPTIKSVISIPIYCWAILALFGFLTPNVKHSFTMYFGGDPSQKKGYPITISFSSKGGFISQNPINVKAEVVDIKPPEDDADEGKERFTEDFDQFHILWIESQSCIKRKGAFLTEQPEAGAILMDIEKCSGESKIEFTSPGKHGIMLMHQKKGGEMQSSKIDHKDIPKSFIHVSPPEVLHNIRLGNITYGLALFVAGFGLFSLLSAIW